MRLLPWFKSRLRHPHLGAGVRAQCTVYRRLADKNHRSLYASLKREASLHKSSGHKLKLRPTMAHFLLFLQQKRDQNLSETTLANSLPTSRKTHAVLEMVMFHLLTCLHSDVGDAAWLRQQSRHLDLLIDYVKPGRSSDGRGVAFSVEDAQSLARSINVQISQQQTEVILQALACVAAASRAATAPSTFGPWLRSLAAPSVRDACSELTNLTYIPACVSSDILLRTPMSKQELDLQLDLWKLFIEPISEAYVENQSRLCKIIENLVYYCVQLDASRLVELLNVSLAHLTSAKKGFQYRVMTSKFANSLIFSLALAYIKNGSISRPSAVFIIRAQSVIVEYLGQSKLDQQGYIGIVLAVSHESAAKAAKLFGICKSHFPEQSDLYHITNIYLSASPEELLHNFNTGVVEYPKSANMWLFLVKKLHVFHLLTERRSQKLLAEILGRKCDIVISKEIIMALIAPIESISGIEDFIATLQQSGLFAMFRRIVHFKYMALLYKYGGEKNVHKPYLNQIIRRNSNLESARYIFHANETKSVGAVGVMLNGESHHQPEQLFDLYTRELQGRAPDEMCLGALLKASMKRINGRVLIWDQMYAPQVAVHEFKQYVQEDANPNPMQLYPSEKLWSIYIEALASAEYMAELADIIRWWEKIQLVPSQKLLLLLLRALPREHVERHIKHVEALPEGGSKWPWPNLNEV